MNILKTITGLEGRYEIDEDGNVFSLLHKKFLKSGITYKGYRYVKLCPQGEKLVKYYIHRLVATAFIPNPDNKPCVNHIDGNKENNTKANLEWVTHEENMTHAVQNGYFDTISKITLQTAQDILCDYYILRSSRKELAYKYQISLTTVSNIIHFKYRYSALRDAISPDVNILYP